MGVYDIEKDWKSNLKIIFAHLMVLENGGKSTLNDLYSNFKRSSNDSNN